MGRFIDEKVSNYDQLSFKTRHSDFPVCPMTTIILNTCLAILELTKITYTDQKYILIPKTDRFGKKIPQPLILLLDKYVSFYYFNSLYWLIFILLSFFIKNTNLIRSFRFRSNS